MVMDNTETLGPTTWASRRQGPENEQTQNKTKPETKLSLSTKWNPLSGISVGETKVTVHLFLIQHTQVASKQSSLVSCMPDFSCSSVHTDHLGVPSNADWLSQGWAWDSACLIHSQGLLSCWSPTHCQEPSLACLCPRAAWSHYCHDIRSSFLPFNPPFPVNSP
jgi:hypothetical protein